MKMLKIQLKLAAVCFFIAASAPAFAQGLTVTNGDFELPAYGPSSTYEDPNGIGVLDWFSPTAGYEAWILGSGRTLSGSQTCEFGANGWIYQPMGTYNAGNGTNLEWTFEQYGNTADGAGNTASFTISFYYSTGGFTPAQGSDIDGAAGVTKIGSYDFNSMADAGLTQRINTGLQDLSSVPSGATVWIRIYDDVADYSPIDNVAVVQDFGGPSFVVNPTAQTNYSLLNVTLTAVASSTSTINYQWYHISTNGLVTNAVAGATGTSLTINEAAVGDSGNYYLNASNSLGSVNSALAYVQILARPAGLATLNGDFELPALGANSQNQGWPADGVTYWFTDDVAYDAWVLGSGLLMDGSQACEFNIGAYIYQPIGVYHASNGTNLDWTLTQVTTTDGQNSADFDIRFYAQTGSFYGMSGTNIEGASGITPIWSDPTATFTSLATLGLTSKQNNGRLNLSGLADGTIVWGPVFTTPRLTARGMDTQQWTTFL